MATAYLSLGSNLGHREANIASALKMLGQEAWILKVSSLYETEPVGYKDQPWFLNCVCSVETDLSPQALLKFVKAIERKLGRREDIRFGPRLIDIDILFYNSLILDSPDLIIPHPRLVERAFVLLPLREIAPELVHPLLRATIEELWQKAENLEGIRFYSEFSSQ
ncbi:MAG: 2-amino-4-hydroxy-6-hydroxymethyldihydropteridine diphosphokinase, partial [Anaerolineae bacterium]